MEFSRLGGLKEANLDLFFLSDVDASSCSDVAGSYGLVLRLVFGIVARMDSASWFSFQFSSSSLSSMLSSLLSALDSVFEMRTLLLVVVAWNSFVTSSIVFQ